MDVIKQFIKDKNWQEVLNYYKALTVQERTQTIAYLHTLDFTVLWELYKHGLIKFDEELFVRALFTIPMFKRNTREDADYLWDNPEVLTKVFLQFYKYEIPVLDTSKWETPNGTVCKRVTEFWTEIFQLLLEKGYVFDRLLIQQLMESLLNNWKKPHLDWHTRLLELLKTSKGEYLLHQNLLFSLLNTGSTGLINFAVKQIHLLYKDEDFDHAGFLANIPVIFSKEKCEKSILISLEIVDSILSKPDYKDKSIAEELSLLLIQPDLKIQEKTALMLVKYIAKELLNELVQPYHDNLKGKPKSILGLNNSVVNMNPESGNQGIGTGNQETKTGNQGTGTGNHGSESANLGTETENYESKIDTHESEIARHKAEQDLLLVPVNIPSTWEELLFQIGACIRTKSALDIDLFFEGLNQLQDIIPSGFEKQLKPYGKQLFNKFWGNEVMTCFADFMDYWINKKAIVNERSEESVPFLKHKSLWMQQKLASGNSASNTSFSGNLISKLKIPFLSTPTHVPFYIHPEILIQRLLQYEAQNIKIEPEDLVVACNRLLYSFVNEESIRLAKTLKGNYADAIHYALGISDELKPTNDLLPLWTQIARIKHPSSNFDRFESTSAKAYPTVCKPFNLDFSVEIDKNEYATWYRLALEDNWNSAWFYQKRTTSYPTLFYNLAPFKTGYREEIPYQMSLTPQYLEALLCRYIPDTSSGNEVAELEDCLYPLQFLLNHQLRIYHSGWLYIAVCLLFEKKISRDLAAEYIEFSILNKKQNLAFLATIIGRLVALNFSPVNRLIEYFDKPVGSIKIKEFQLLVLESCIQHFDVNKIPANSKKIIAYYIDWSKSLSKEIDTLTLAKLKGK
ncbi:DUF6493 family protein [Pedobacter cryoconitis]|uniref:Uncharacterized protein n=1 Tax=Pedobacter cryoconitis TaxID=188932 RepID=A0A327S6E8_9SPHI|nr:DUF6493 family protein [Pedobacter cryoconitis]RAJ24650.1 hypothetical protein LY11_04371 [Pedobacter cryoconitis]